MSWEELETIFNRALKFSFSRKKLLCVLPITLFCGFISALCRTFSFAVSDWFHLNLVFLPIFLCSSILMIAGIILTRIYHHEVKGLNVDYRKIILQSRGLFLGIFHMAVPLVFAYLGLWMIMGVFYLAKNIFYIGDILGAILSFGPFLLVLGALVLSVFNLILLFFATPQVALKSDHRPQVPKEIFMRFNENPFITFILPLIGILPVLFLAGLLSLAAVVTQIMYVDAEAPLSAALKWFFMMLPFSILLSPAIVFFFNFSAESYVLMQRKFKAGLK